MRVLLAASVGGAGHLTPVLIVARALRRVGHEALVLVPPALARAADGSGLPYVVGDEPPRAVFDAVWEKVRAGPPDAVTGVIDRELFADAATRAMLGAARAVRDSWRPDVVVREPCEYASAVVAHEAGLAQAQVGISGAAIERGVLRMVAPIVERFGTGVAAAIDAAPYLTQFPPSLDPSPWTDTRRFSEPVQAAAALPDWWSGDDRPLVYVTFGSVTGHLPEAAGVYRTALDSVSGLPARVLLTVGRGFDPRRLGSVPANTRVEQWVPQADVLARAALVFCHGGSGTTLGALAAGVPLVVCPLFADQGSNGRLVRAAGCGVVVTGRGDAPGQLRSLGPEDVEPLREAVVRVLGEPAYRRAAERMAGEMAALPPLDDVVGRLVG